METFEQYPVAKILTAMKRREKIPQSTHRAAIRARLLDAYPEIKLSIVATRIGFLGLAWNARGIVALHLPRGDAEQTLRDLQREFPRASIVEDAPASIARELQEYAAGRLRQFDLPLDWSSIKPFQRAVLMAASKIPFGETRTYAWIAQKIGKPRASRAVGRALGANPIPIILPCHRVIGSDGGLRGYGGGLELKEKLLRLEGALL
jgi:O-6-methylguanine DNA methyltransferase